MDNQKFGQFIASIRKEKGWTQRELAEKLLLSGHKWNSLIN